MKKNLSVFFKIAIMVLLLINGALLNAQVTIGDNKPPEPFSVLELISNNKGLRLPQIETTAQRDAVFTNAAGFATNPLAIGLQIFNLQTKRVEVWNGTTWIGVEPSVYTATLPITLNGNAFGLIPGEASGQILVWNGTEWELAENSSGSNYSGSTSIILNGTSFERAALTGDVTAQQNSNATVIANNAVTSAKILDGTIIAADLNQMGATDSQVLTWSGSTWAPITPDSAWHLKGNGGTTPGTHFIGTTDNKDLIFKRGGVQAGWLNYKDGNLCNTAFGVAALPTTTTGALNTAVGYSALSTNSGGSRNTAMGHLALSVNTGGTDNTAVGSRALIAATANYNTAIGSNAMSNVTTAGSNTAVGSNALQNTTMSGNTAVGTDALRTNTSGQYNTAVGSATLVNSTTGGSNTTVGSSSMELNTIGANNTAVGTKALQNNNTGNNNTVLGNSAGGVITTGSNNIVIGDNSGSNIKNGSNNIVIGNYTELPNLTPDYQLNIGNIIRGTNIGTVTTWDTDPGRIGIGTDNPQSTLEVNGAITNTNSYNAGTLLTIKFEQSNLARSTATGDPTFVLTGLKDGGTYTLAWQSNTQGTAYFDTGLFTPKMISTPLKTASQHIVYSIVCIGSVAYIYPVVFN